MGHNILTGGHRIRAKVCGNSEKGRLTLIRISLCVHGYGFTFLCDFFLLEMIHEDITSNIGNKFFF